MTVALVSDSALAVIVEMSAASALERSASRLDGGVEGEQVCLVSDVVDETEDPADVTDPVGEGDGALTRGQDALVGAVEVVPGLRSLGGDALHRLGDVTGCPGQLLHARRRLDRRRGLLGGGRHQLGGRLGETGGGGGELAAHLPDPLDHPSQPLDHEVEGLAQLLHLGRPAGVDPGRQVARGDPPGQPAEGADVSGLAGRDEPGGRTEQDHTDETDQDRHRVHLARHGGGPAAAGGGGAEGHHEEGYHDDAGDDDSCDEADEEPVQRPPDRCSEVDHDSLQPAHTQPAWHSGSALRCSTARSKGGVWFA